MEIFILKAINCGKNNYIFKDVKWCFDASRWLKGHNASKRNFASPKIDLISYTLEWLF